jgi:asparagine synthase (glutamine-hydrolysing)
MFARYALVVGRGARRGAIVARAEAAGLQPRAETSELLLVASAETSFVADRRSILVGQLFTIDNHPVTEVPRGLGDSSCASELKHALKGCWGNYAVFFGGPGRSGAYRDPSGAVAAYRIVTADGAIYVSDAEVASKLGLLDGAAPDFRFVVHWLQFPFLRTRRTGLRGIEELLPGMLAIREGSGEWREENVWNPQAFLARKDAITDPAEAATRLRELALQVVPAQLGSQGQFLLRLSGGLDSSIIAACLARGGTRFSCVNFATRSSDGDERHYARDAAEAAGAPLHQILEPSEIGLDTPARPSFCPTTNPLLAPFESAIGSAAQSMAASLLVDGAGGDNLFCAISSAAPVVDALRTSRLGDAAKAVGDISRRANCTAPHVILAAMRRLARRSRRWKEDQSYLARDALLPCAELHPWLARLRALPGKKEHVEALVHIHHFLDRGSASTRLLHPLLCQPLLELCLRVPTWLWVRGGRDRAVARAAFAGIVPSSVLDRRAKGSLQSMFHRSFRQLRQEMLELLLSGELSAAGIIDEDGVSTALESDEWQRDHVQLRISEMVALELWLRCWRSPAAAFSTGS